MVIPGWAIDVRVVSRLGQNQDVIGVIMSNNCSRNIIFIFILTALFPRACFSSVKLDILDVQYPSAFDFVRKDESKLVGYCTYKVLKKYPSLDVYNYYKKILSNQSVNEINITSNVESRWFDFVDGTLKNEPIVHQFVAQWVDKDKKEMFILVINYFSKHGKINKYSIPDNDIQYISFQRRPFVDIGKKK
jgi:hypothetical protein